MMHPAICDRKARQTYASPRFIFRRPSPVSALQLRNFARPKPMGGYSVTVPFARKAGAAKRSGARTVAFDGDLRRWHLETRSPINPVPGCDRGQGVCVPVSTGLASARPHLDTLLRPQALAGKERIL